MSEERDVVSRLGRGNSMQPIVVLVGTSLHFSDQMLRILRSEFPEVHFDRTCEISHLLETSPGPNLVIVHEAVDDLATRIGELRSALAGSIVAVACCDVSVFQRAYHSDPSRPISLLQLNTQIDVWLSILRLLLCGHQYVPADLVRDWSAEPASAAPPAREANGNGGDAQLTPREMQILPLIAQGLQNKTIAGELGLSEHTVKLHTHNIFSKLRVSNRTGAANWYLSQAETGQYSHAK